MGDTLRPVPIEAVRFLKLEQAEGDEKEWQAVIKVSKDRFTNAPTLEEDSLSSLADREGADELATYYEAKSEQREHDKKICKVSDLIGVDVRDARKDEDIGELEEIVFESKDGTIRYGALSFGGFFEGSDRLFAVPWDSIQLTRSADEDEIEYVTVTQEVNEEALSNARGGFSPDNWPAEADREWSIASQPERTAERDDTPRR